MEIRILGLVHSLMGKIIWAKREFNARTWKKYSLKICEVSSETAITSIPYEVGWQLGVGGGKNQKTFLGDDTWSEARILEIEVYEKGIF